MDPANPYLKAPGEREAMDVVADQFHKQFSKAAWLLP